MMTHGFRLTPLLDVQASQAPQASKEILAAQVNTDHLLPMKASQGIAFLATYW